MNSFLAQQIKDIAAERILGALENGDPIQEARDLRAEIREAWSEALEAAGVPEVDAVKLRFPI